ncbi:hypothetical protein MBLNU13_g07855t1 [Cladosporium sp. NU13]
MASPQPNPSSPSPPSPSSVPPEPDADNADADATLPMTMAASVVLDHLPKDATRALETAGEIELAKGMPFHSLLPPYSPTYPPTYLDTKANKAKVTIRLSPLPNTPSLRQPRFKCSSNQRFESIVRFLRRKLGLGEHEGVFCYVNSVFAPGLDEGVGNLWRCFKTGEELVVSYSVTQAFG